MVYLIHFEKPYKHARHYIGYTRSLNQRIDRHRSGDGSPLLRAASAAGIEWSVVRTWKGGRDLERKLKNRKKASEICPCCRKERGRCKTSANKLTVTAPPVS